MSGGSFLTDTRTDAEVLEAIAPEHRWVLTLPSGGEVTINVVSDTVIGTHKGTVIGQCYHGDQGVSDPLSSVECAIIRVRAMVVAGATVTSGPSLPTDRPDLEGHAVLLALAIRFGIVIGE